jgi:hypothetical protein
VSGEGSPCGMLSAPNSAVKRPPFIAESHISSLRWRRAEGTSETVVFDRCRFVIVQFEI